MEYLAPLSVIIKTGKKRGENVVGVYVVHKLSVSERYELFKHTLHECSSDLLDLNINMFESCVFEEMPIDIVTFLYKDTLKVLMDEGLINEVILEKSLELREYYMSVEQGFGLETVKASPELKHIMVLSDEIIKLLYI